MPLVAFSLQGLKCGLPPVPSKYTVTHFSVYKVLPFNTYILKGLLSSIIIRPGTALEPSKGYNDRPSTAPPHPPALHLKDSFPFTTQTKRSAEK